MFIYTEALSRTDKGYPLRQVSIDAMRKTSPELMLYLEESRLLLRQEGPIP